MLATNCFFGGATCVTCAEDYLTATMEQRVASVLTTVNAPYSVRLDDAALAHCLTHLDFAKLFAAMSARSR